MVHVLWAAVVEAYESHEYIGDCLNDMQSDESLRGNQKRKAASRLKEFEDVTNEEPDDDKLRISLLNLAKELKMHYRRKV